MWGDADFCASQISSLIRSVDFRAGQAGSDSLQIGLGCRFYLWADQLIPQDEVSPRFTRIPDFPTAQVQVTCRFQRSPALHVTQQILDFEVDRFLSRLELSPLQIYPCARFQPAPDFTDFTLL